MFIIRWKLREYSSAIVYLPFNRKYLCNAYISTYTHSALYNTSDANQTAPSDDLIKTFSRIKSQLAPCKYYIGLVLRMITRPPKLHICPLYMRRASEKDRKKKDTGHIALACNV